MVIQEDEGLFENYFIEKLKFQDEYGKTIISDEVVRRLYYRIMSNIRSGLIGLVITQKNTYLS